MAVIYCIFNLNKNDTERISSGNSWLGRCSDKKFTLKNEREVRYFVSIDFYIRSIFICEILFSFGAFREHYLLCCSRNSEYAN